MSIFNKFDEYMLYNDVCSISFAEVLTWFKVFRMGCALATVTLEAPTTACLGNTCIMVSHLGYTLATVTPEDVLILGSAGHVVHCGASGA
jgi:hypothetical protein